MDQKEVISLQRCGSLSIPASWIPWKLRAKQKYMSWDRKQSWVLINGLNKLVFKVLSVSTEVHRFCSAQSSSFLKKAWTNLEQAPFLCYKENIHGPSPKQTSQRSWLKPSACLGLQDWELRLLVLRSTSATLKRETPVEVVAECLISQKRVKEAHLHKQWSWFKDHPSNSQ